MGYTWVRRLTSVAVALLVALLAGVALIVPAAAAVTSANPADGYGELYADFTTDDALFAYVTSDTRGGRVCVIAAEGEGNCENPAFGTPNIIVGIGTMYTLIEGPDLPMGSYRLRAESPSFGDEGWVSSYTSDVFSVGPCEVDCELQIGRAQADAFKASSAEMTEAARVACAAFEIHGMAEEVKDDVDDIDEGDIKGFEVPGSQPDTRSLDTGGRIAAIVGGVGILFLDLGPSQGSAHALEIAQRMSCQVSKMHDDIANDPPDPTLHEVAEPEFLDVPTTGNAALDALNETLDRQAAHGIAARIAYERYQGAVAAEDLAPQRLQAGAAAEQARHLVTELRASAAALRDVAAAAPGTPEMAGPVVASAEHLAELSGLTDGPHVLVVLATGAGGESEPAEHRWVVDTTAPVVHIVAGPSDSTATTALIEFQVKDPDAPDGSPPLAVTCALGGATPVACDGGVFSLTGLTAGAHEVVVTATDGAGNAGSATHRWVVEAGEGPTPRPHGGSDARRPAGTRGATST